MAGAARAGPTSALERVAVGPQLHLCNISSNRGRHRGERKVLVRSRSPPRRSGLHLSSEWICSVVRILREAKAVEQDD